MHKYFQGRKYYLARNRWTRTTLPHIHLSRDVWNYHYPNDPVLEGEIVHHISEDTMDDKIENLQKMTFGEHNSLHKTGEKNHNWKGGVSSDEKYKREYKRRYDKRNKEYKSEYNKRYYLISKFKDRKELSD